MKYLLNILTMIMATMLATSTSSAEEKYHIFKVTYTIKNISTRIISVGLILVDIPKHRELLPESTVYNETLSYSKQQPFGNEHGRSTSAHETVHGINSELRNQYKTTLKKNVNAFYAGGGKAIVVENPPITLRDVIPNIPNVLKGYRYNLYFVKQLGDWNDVPTYPMDEWSAYIAGAECAVDDLHNGLPKEKSDCVSGALEFSIYVSALAMTVKQKHPDYWHNNEQFKNAVQYFLIKSERIFFQGQDKFAFKEQDKLLEHLRNHKDGTELRNFLMTEFQGIFVD